MKLKRTLLVLLSSTIIVSALVGCAVSNNNAGLTEDGKILLKVSTEPKDLNEKQYNASMERYAQFEEFYKNEYPDSKGVHIEPHFYKFSTKDYAAMAIGDQLATYYSVPMTEARTVINVGYGRDITKWMKEYGYLNGIDDRVKENIIKDGKCYLMPTQLYTVGIAVNMEILKQAGYVAEDGTPYQPKDYEELAQMAGEIKKKTGKAGFVLPTTGNSGGWRFTPIAWAYGVDFMEQDKDGNWQATFNTPECVAALQWVKDLKWKYDAIPENVLMSNAMQKSSFGAGESAMAFSESGSVNSYIKAGMKKDNIGLIQIPAGPKRRVTLIGGAYDVFSANITDEQVDTVFKFKDWAGAGRVFDEAVKQKMEEDIKIKSDEGALIGILNASPYTDKDPKRAYEIYLNTEKYVNINMNHVKLYNDQSGIEWQMEEPVEAQALYAVLDNAIQAVLTDKNADCAKLIDEAYKNFQVTLDTVNNS